MKAKFAFHIDSKTGIISSYFWISKGKPPILMESISEFADKIRIGETSQLKSIGIAMPIEFPFDKYESIHHKMEKYSKGPKYKINIWMEFAGGWKAAAYRFLACKEHCGEFTKSIINASSTPIASERYLQDKELYGFFVNGISSFESYFYSLYMIGALTMPTKFPFNRKIMKHINPENVLKIFSGINMFKNQKFIKRGENILRSKEYKKWYDIRNILVHRSAPGRRIYMTDDSVEWHIKKIPINKNTAITRYIWLASEITQQAAVTDEFLCKFIA